MQRGDIPFLGAFSRPLSVRARAEGRADERRHTGVRLRALRSVVLARRDLHVEAASRTRIDARDVVERLMRRVQCSTRARCFGEVLRGDD